MKQSLNFYVDKELLKEFDENITEQGFRSRTEAFNVIIKLVNDGKLVIGRKTILEIRNNNKEAK